MMTRPPRKSPSPPQQQRLESNTLPRRKKSSPKNKGLTPSPPLHSLSASASNFGSLNSVHHQSPDSMWRSSSVSISSCDSLTSPGDDMGDELHPLQNSWKFWFINAAAAGNNWSKHMKEIRSFTTVEDFWGIWDQLKSPLELPIQYSYYMFKSVMRPEWEDKGNRNGGRWLITFNRKSSKLNDAWLETVMGIIGEMFDEDGEEICGAAMDVRRADKVSVWTKDWQNRESIMRIGEKIQAAWTGVGITFGVDAVMHYERHDKPKSEGALYRL